MIERKKIISRYDANIVYGIISISAEVASSSWLVSYRKSLNILNFELMFSYCLL